jgi:hypothetical protein
VATGNCSLYLYIVQNTFRGPLMKDNLRLTRHLAQLAGYALFLSPHARYGWPRARVMCSCKCRQSGLGTSAMLRPAARAQIIAVVCAAVLADAVFVFSAAGAVETIANAVTTAYKTIRQFRSNRAHAAFRAHQRVLWKRPTCNDSIRTVLWSRTSETFSRWISSRQARQIRI